MSPKERAVRFIRDYRRTFCYLAGVVLVYIAAVVTVLLVKEFAR